MVTQSAQTLPAFIEPEGSTASLRKAANRTYPKPD